MAWYLDYRWNGKDAYPLIRQAITERPEVYNEEHVRNEMFLHLDYYVTESSGHNSEYNWWFRKRPDLIEKYCTDGTGWNPGALRLHPALLRRGRGDLAGRGAAVVRQRDADLARARQRVRRLHHQRRRRAASRSSSTATCRTRAISPTCRRMLRGSAGVGEQARAWSRCTSAPLPPQCAALTNLSAQIEEMAVEGALTGDPRLVYQAICARPADRGGAVAGRDQGNGQRDVRAEPALPAAVQACHGFM